MSSDLTRVLERIVLPHLGDTFPACSACVLHRGAVVLESAWGWIDPETRRIPVMPNTYFDLASLTKLFTATTFLRQVSAGHSAIDDRLATVIPEFGIGGARPIDGGQDPHSKELLPIDPAYAGQSVDPRRVTFRHLLTHTSGLSPWHDVYNAVDESPPPPPDHSDPIARAVRRERTLAALCAYPFVGQPDGATVRYSDIGYMLLGEAVMRLTGHDTPRDTLDRGVRFNPRRDYDIPLDRIAPTEIDSVYRQRRCWGEVHDENAAGLGGLSGHAGLFGTARAIAVFGERWRTGTVPGITPDIHAEAVREQVNDHDTRRGLGFALRARGESMVGDYASDQAYGHSGFTGTTLWIDPVQEWVIVLLTNRVYPGRDHDGAAGSITDFRRGAHDAIVKALPI
ncbi:MAG: serine hydrolase domain-containing protein [Chloroflexota bacterium]|nr:serine hydrolase domain-containing protein [Chloroflexota bacterium]